MSYYPIPYMNENIYQLRDLKSVPTVELAYCGDYNIEVRNILPLYKAVTAMNNVHLTICGEVINQLKVVKMLPFMEEFRLKQCVR